MSVTNGFAAGWLFSLFLVSLIAGRPGYALGALILGGVNLYLAIEQRRIDRSAS